MPKKKTFELGLEKDKYVSHRRLTLLCCISFVAGAALVYLWYEPFVWESKKLLRENIYDLEEQRDQLLFHRSELKRELDVAYEEISRLKGN